MESVDRESRRAMIHRREIDGLRALAVVPVICYHAGLSWFSGGFLGVDVFFVVSGFLIIGLMLEELLAGTFSLRQFYIRRARRILPALYVVVLATLPFAYGWLLPEQYREYSKSLLSVLVFASNFVFWSESGYFAPEASEKPLLHSWSLGVEEQFYILMPLFMMMAWRYGRKHLGTALLMMAAVSLMLCEYASYHAPAANFYLLPTRIWELALGGYAAWHQRQQQAQYRPLLSVLGLSLIGFSVIYLDDAMRLPSLLTLVPVLGTVLILRCATSETLVARLLSARPLVAIGLVSYSAYLWHHPLLAFARVMGLSIQRPESVAAFLMLTFALAWFSWRYVEQPFRNKLHAAYVSGKRALGFAAVAAALIAAVGVQGYISQGRLALWKATAPATQVKAYELLESARDIPRYFDNGDCVFNISEMSQTVQQRLDACAAKYGKGVAVIGDSHAINLFYMMKLSAPREAFLVGIAQGACRPHSDTPDCYYGALRDFLTSHPSPFRAILYTQAGFYLMNDRHGKPLDRNDVVGTPLDSPWPEFTPNDNYIHAVRRYLESLAVQKATRVIWVGPHVSPHLRLPVMVRMGCDADFHLRPQQTKFYEQLDDAIARNLVGSSIAYRSQLDWLKFDMARDFMNCDATYFTDGDHYSAAGEARFAKRETLQILLNERP